MPFQLAGGNAANQDYDYQSGSGMDNFMSRSIDEVSWQSSLGTNYNTLSELPIGLLPTTATPTNNESTQVSGASSGTAVLGGTGTGNASGGGSAASGTAAAINIDSGSQNITIFDGTNNRLILGLNPTTNTWGGFSTPPGINITNAKTPQQLAWSTDYPSLIVLANEQVQFPAIPVTTTEYVWQQFVIPHGQPNIPAFFAYVYINFKTTPIANFAQNYYAPIISNISFADPQNTLYSFYVGVDTVNLYLQRLITNSMSNVTANPSTVTYQILQQTAGAVSLNPNAVYTSGSQIT